MEANSIINNIHRVMVSAQRIKPRIVQDLYKIIRWCIAPAKINHFLRNIPKATLLPYIKAYDEAVYNLTLTITSLDHSLLSNHAQRSPCLFPGLRAHARFPVAHALLGSQARVSAEHLPLPPAQLISMLLLLFFSGGSDSSPPPAAAAAGFTKTSP
jgi:hypothetical protein